ncbi:MAG: DUF2283 domain-containing protein [Desulfurococcales archaeon]|nr:DUF2283 domain-containing protein [Desulfurococcales archaeon]
MPVEFSIKYDRLSDILYIKLRDDKVVDSDEVEPGVIVDYNEKGEIIGIEVLWFSRRKLDLSKLILSGPEALVAEV